MFPGCEAECRIVGVLRANQRENGKENRNDRLIAVVEGSVLYTRVNQLSDLEETVLLDRAVLHELSESPQHRIRSHRARRIECCLGPIEAVHQERRMTIISMCANTTYLLTAIFKSRVSKPKSALTSDSVELIAAALLKPGAR